MTNPFSNEALVPTWTAATEILKGDTQGHPFHGNQYSAGQGGGGNTPAQLDPTRNQVETDRYDGAATRNQASTGRGGSKESMSPDNPRWQKQATKKTLDDLQKLLVPRPKDAVTDMFGIGTYHPNIPDKDAITQTNIRIRGEVQGVIEQIRSGSTVKEVSENLGGRLESLQDRAKSHPDDKDLSLNVRVVEAVKQYLDNSYKVNNGHYDYNIFGKQATPIEMSTNQFSLDSLVPNWTVATEILKGDLPGHAFHGNQYSHAQLAEEHMDKANQLARNAGNLVMSDQPDLAQKVLDRANDHERASLAHAEADKNPSPEASRKAFELSAIANKGAFEGGFANADSRSVGASSEALSPYHHGYYTGQAMALVRSARGLTTNVGSVISPEQADRDAATHELIAEKHRQIADALKKGDTAQQRQAEVHGLAADAHEQAAYLLNRLSSGPTFSANVAEYKSVNDNAAMFSRVAGKLMFDVNGGNVEGQLEELHLAEGADSEDLQTAHELIAEQHGNQAEMLREMAREERAAGRPNGDLLERIAAHNEASRRHDDVAMRIAAIDADDNPHPVSQKQALASSLEAGRGSDDASKTAR